MLFCYGSKIDVLLSRQNARSKRQQIKNQHWRLDQFFDRLAGRIFQGVGDLDRTAHRRHVLLVPLDSHRLVDRSKDITQADLAFDALRALLIALAHCQAGTNATSAQSSDQQIGQ